MDTSDPSYIDGLINEFNATLAEFENLYRRLLGYEETAKSDAVLNQRYLALISRANALQGTIERAREGVTELQDFLANSTPDFIRNILNGNNQLGFIPILVGGAVAGASALLGFWISDASAIADQLQAQENAIRAGGDPEQVTRDIFNPEQSGGFFGSIGLGTLALIGGGIFLYRKFVK